MKIPNQLDQADRAILDRLQRDGRASHADLAEVAHLSAPQCFRRVRRLEEEGSHFLAQLASPEAREAFAAFAEKRAPDFAKLR